MGSKPTEGGGGNDALQSYEDLFEEDEADLDRPDLIRRRAYELWRQSGRTGHPADYLAKAESEITAEENSDFKPNPYPLNRAPDEA